MSGSPPALPVPRLTPVFILAQEPPPLPAPPLFSLLKVKQLCGTPFILIGLHIDRVAYFVAVFVYSLIVRPAFFSHG